MNKRHYIKKVITAILILYSHGSLGSNCINKIIIEGNNRIEASTIENYLGITKGAEYSDQKVSEGIKNLYSTSLFSNVNIRYNNGNLIVSVVENCFISKVEITGNSKLSTKVLTEEIITRVGESVSNFKIQEDLKKIEQMYKSSGRLATKVTYRIEPLDNNRVKVIFDVREGPKTTIKNIHFVGNENYSSSELRSIILTKESRWYKFLEKNDSYDPARIEYDKALLIEFYRSLGYVDVNVISTIAEISSNKEYFTLTYTIDEGKRYKIGKINLENKLSNINSNEIQKLIKIKCGQLYNIKDLDKVSENITSYLSNTGYPRTEISYNVVNKDTVNNTVDITYLVERADKVFVNYINIDGNLKTKEEIIRREFKISEGDVFSRLPIEKAENNLRSLDFFEKVTTNITPTKDKDRYDINVEVQEKSTSDISFDVGYNSATGPFGKFNFTERNLFGEGKLLSLGVDVSKTTTNYYLVFGNPYFLGKDLDLSITFFKNYEGEVKFKKRKITAFNIEQQPYTRNAIGVRPSLEYAINENLFHTVDYTIKQEKISGDRNSLARSIIEQLGTYVTSSIGHTITYSTLDNRLVPKNGYIASFSQEYAGLGGNNKYFKNEIEAKTFYSIYNNKITLKLMGNAGNIRGVQGKNVKISDRFNLGDYSFRGFAGRGIGPRDKLTKESLGGQNFYSFTTEVLFPLSTGTSSDFDLKGLVFADFGSVWGIDFKRNKNYRKEEFYHDKDLRSSVGFGFIWTTRFAPIRLDWGFPIRKKEYDETQNFHIKFSTHF